MRAVHLLPSKRYSFRDQIKQHVIPPLELKGVMSARGACAELAVTLGELNAADDEGKVPVRLARMGAALQAAGTCDALLLAEVDAARRRTEHTVGDYTLSRGEILEVTVTRPDDPTKTWTATFDAGPRGDWQASYGFAFAPNDDELYFSRAAGEGKFQVTREEDRGGYGSLLSCSTPGFPPKPRSGPPPLESAAAPVSRAPILWWPSGSPRPSTGISEWSGE